MDLRCKPFLHFGFYLSFFLNKNVLRELVELVWIMQATEYLRKQGPHTHVFQLKNKNKTYGILRIFRTQSAYYA